MLTPLCLLMLALAVAHAQADTTAITSTTTTTSPALSGETGTGLMARAHRDRMGVRWPQYSFKSALRSASAEVEGFPGRQVVFLAMASAEALNMTVRVMLDSMSTINITTSNGRVKPLSEMLVLMAWGQESWEACRKQAQAYGHRCVDDNQHKLEGRMAFHSAAFNALGYAKVKYIVNAVSLGYDTIFLAADVVILRNPLPYILGLRADVAAQANKCEVVDDRVNYAGAITNRTLAHLPPPNIGVLFLRATPGVTRCMYAWYDFMFTERNSPQLWDQENFSRMIVECSDTYDLDLRIMDPRVVASACQKNCGCDYPNADRARIWRTHKWFPRLGQPFAGEGTNRCEPHTWANWVLMHFPCQGKIQDKKRVMRNLLNGFRTNTSAVIKTPKD